MTNSKAISMTGFVMPVGNGAVGKTSVSKILDFISKGNEADGSVIMGIKKTMNLEFEYVTSNQKFGNTQYSITMQFLIPPGQKKNDGENVGRSFEDVIDIFKSMIRRLDVVLFTYDLSKVETFRDLDYWLYAAQELFNDATHFILLGTHLDKKNDIEIKNDEIKDGLEFLEKEMLKIRPTWVGKSSRLEISNLTGENLTTLLQYISGSIINATKLSKI